MPNEPVRNFTLKQCVALGIILIVLYGASLLLIELKEVFLLSFFSILLAIPTSSLIALLSRYLPRTLAVLATLILLSGLFGGLGAISVPVIAEQMQELIQKIPEASRKLEKWYLRTHHAESQLQEQASKAVGPILQTAVPVVTKSVSSVLMTLYVLILAAFLAADPQRYRQGLRSLIPKKHRIQFDHLWNQLSSDLVRWLKGILVSMIIMGILTAIGLWLIGQDQWLLLGTLALLGTFVPYVGAFISSVPGLVLGLAKSDTDFLYTLLVYLGIHLTEGHLVQPLVMKKAVEIQPGLLIFWQVAIALILGIPGVIVATPLLVCLKTLLNFFYFEQTSN